MGLEQRITAILEDLFDQQYNDLFAVDLQVGKDKVTIFVDGDNGVNIDQCRSINKQLRNSLEEQDPEFENFMLEVSSPGADRPMKLWRQYGKHIGRNLEVTMKDGTRKEGRLKEMTADSLVLETVKKKETGEVEIPFTEVEESIVKISFN